MGLCERCRKAQATFHLTNIDRNGSKVERHLCDKCASEEGLLSTGGNAHDVNDILQTFISGSKAATSNLGQLVCTECGISYVEFRNQGLLGCAHDYDVFKEHLVRLLERAHNGATHHVGKAPKSDATTPRPAARPDMKKLRRQLEEAVSAEDYERAAKLRDRIRTLEES